MTAFIKYIFINNDFKEFHKSRKTLNSTPYASESDLGYFVTNSDAQLLSCAIESSSIIWSQSSF